VIQKGSLALVRTGRLKITVRSSTLHEPNLQSTLPFYHILGSGVIWDTLHMTPLSCNGDEQMRLRTVPTGTVLVPSGWDRRILLEAGGTMHR